MTKQYMHLDIYIACMTLFRKNKKRGFIIYFELFLIYKWVEVKIKMMMMK